METCHLEGDCLGVRPRMTQYVIREQDAIGRRMESPYQRCMVSQFPWFVPTPRSTNGGECCLTKRACQNLELVGELRENKGIES